MKPFFSGTSGIEPMIGYPSILVRLYTLLVIRVQSSRQRLPATGVVTYLSDPEAASDPLGFYDVEMSLSTCTVHMPPARQLLTEKCGAP